MKFSWSGRKRAANIKAHGLDFLDAPRVFEGLTFTFEDDRFAYGEQRFVTLGLLSGVVVSIVHVVVSIVHTESEVEICVISFRKATKREEAIYFSQVQD
ncbi:MAG: BrnT family toxin [Parahaliea sp.]